MALDAYITQEIRAPRIGEEEYDHVLRFFDDGYFWFLYPLLKELESKTGQLIKLTDDAAFNGPTLDIMLEIIAQARDLISKQPDVWDVHVGTKIFLRPKKKIYSTINKREFEELLNQWKKLQKKQKSRTHISHSGATKF